MILACPSCATRYFTDDGAVGDTGRTVRCAACGHSWFVAPDGETAEAPPSPEPAKPKGPTRADVERARRAEVRPHEQMRARIQARGRRAAVAGVAKAWIGVGALFAAGLGVCIVNRASIVEAWPKSASAYAMVGLKVNAFGLDFFEVKAARTYRGLTPVLMVEGEVRNVGKRARNAPAVRVALRDKKGKEIYHWDATIDALTIKPGEAAPFKASLGNPPPGAYAVVLTFADVENSPEGAPTLSAVEESAHPEAAPAAPPVAPGEGPLEGAPSDAHPDLHGPQEAHG
jgi:predicted Zn finger-like uncharacterized protein